MFLGTWTISGYEALVNVINQFSLVDMVSKLFKSDILEFLESKKRMEEDIVLSVGNSAVTASEIRLSVRSMSVRLHALNKDLIVSELVAAVEMQFTCSASLMNGQPSYLDVSISYLAIFSMLNTVLLVEGSRTSSSCPDMILSVSDNGKNKVCMSLPCLDIWLHTLDWHEVVILLDYYFTQLAKALTDVSMKSTETVADVAIDMSWSSTTSSSFPSSDVTDYSIVKLERVSLTAYVPIQFTRDVFSMFKEHPSDSFNMICRHPSGFVVLSLQSSCSEIISDDKAMILKIRFEKVEGVLQVHTENVSRTWPLFHLLHINLEAEILNHQFEHKHATFDVLCESLDLGLSDDMLLLYHCIRFEAAQTGPSQSIFTSINFRVQLGKLSLLLTDSKVKLILWSCSIMSQENPKFYSVEFAHFVFSTILFLYVSSYFHSF